MDKAKRKTFTAYEAYWFLYEHPKMQARECQIVSSAEAKRLKKDGETIISVADDMPWCKKKYSMREFKAIRHALECNLSIYFAKVGTNGRVSSAKGAKAECWLEFGPIEWAVAEGYAYLKHYHDVNLDCGAPTFDEALIKLAKLVKKNYGVS